MKETYIADTLLYEDDEYETKDVQVWFTVPRDWATEWCKENEWESLDQFNDEYIWDDSYEMYIAALDDDVILSEERDVV